MIANTSAMSEKMLIFLKHLEACGGNKTKASEMTGWSVQYAWRLQRDNTQFGAACAETVMRCEETAKAKKDAVQERGKGVFGKVVGKERARGISVRLIQGESMEDVRRVFLALGGSERLFAYIEASDSGKTGKLLQKERDKRYAWFTEKVFKPLYQSARAEHESSGGGFEGRTLEQLLPILVQQRADLDRLASEFPKLKQIMPERVIDVTGK